MPSDGVKKRGRRKISYIDNLHSDTGLKDTDELKACILDRESWQERVLTLRRMRGRSKQVSE